MTTPAGYNNMILSKNSIFEFQIVHNNIVIMFFFLSPIMYKLSFGSFLLNKIFYTFQNIHFDICVHLSLKYHWGPRERKLSKVFTDFTINEFCISGNKVVCTYTEQPKWMQKKANQMQMDFCC